MKNLKYVIVGSGRSGTVYCAKLLTSLGILCGHESFFDYQGIEGALLRLNNKIPLALSGCSQVVFENKIHNIIPPYIPQPQWQQIIAESSYMAVPYLHHECLERTEVIHAVRHPVKVVNSFINYLNYFYHPSICIPPNPIYEAFIYRHLPELQEYSAPYERAAMYYVLWNEMIETRTTVARFRVEDGPAPLKSLLGVSGDAFDDRKVNTYEVPGERFNLKKLPSGEIKDRFVAIGERYGYKMSLEYLLM